MAYTTIDDPSEYFGTTIYTGNETARAITFDGNSDLDVDWIWLKSRSASGNHHVYDTVRGTQKFVRTNLTNAEGTNGGTDGVTAFGSNGFTVGANTGSNADGVTFVGWGWKAGTSVSGNSTGSGTAKAYSGSVSTDAGFSIIKYIGNGTSAHTIPHHLGAVPQWVLIKETSNSSDWMGYHIGIGNTKTIKLNEPDAPVDRTDWWNDTTPTSSVVTLGDNGEINQNDTNYIMYAWCGKQGYSKFGIFTGNGNADGAFIYTGFSPAWVVVKRSDDSNGWLMNDNKRSPFNVSSAKLETHLGSAESSFVALDFLSNGFKIRTNDADMGASGGTYIYMAFAQQPFVTSTGVPATAR